MMYMYVWRKERKVRKKKIFTGVIGSKKHLRLNFSFLFFLLCGLDQLLGFSVSVSPVSVINMITVLTS